MVSLVLLGPSPTALADSRNESGKDANAAEPSGLPPLHTIPEAHSLPIGRAASLPIGIAGQNDKQGTLHNHADGGFTLVYESGIGDSIDHSRLFSIVSADGLRATAPEELELLDRPLVTSAAFVRARGIDWLHFTTGEALSESPELWRSVFDGERFSTPESLPTVPELERMTGWPQWVAHDDRIALSFRNRRGRPFWALYAPDAPINPMQIEDVGASYVRVVPMTGGGWLLSYQLRPTGTNTLTYVRISADGQSWSPAESITLPDWPEVHDAFALPRRDRGVDLYYVYPSPKQQARSPFVLYRRAVLGPGHFGPEQRLTAPEDFGPYSPSAHRLANGSVLLTFSNILATGSGAVTEAQLNLVRLPGDAPLVSDGGEGTTPPIVE
jgi:hypothetical protein